MERETVDTAYFVETPEGIDLEAQLAGPVPRVLAYAIDVFYRSLILFGLFIVLAFFGKMGMGVFLVVTFLLEWFYPVFFEVFYRGQTPGKRSLKLAVVNEDLTPVTWGASVTRNLLRAADFMPFAYLIGLVAMSMGRNFQRLGDLAAGTIVIHRRPLKKAEKLPDHEPVMAPVALELDDQIAFINFAQRHKQLTQARQEELAQILKDVIKQENEAAVKTVHGIGAWLLGAK
ncbi:MAG: RDD family protein [Gammaproteobacteria bacterium]|nr:RDD family protein [Gammaproteobacteria bacterium]MDH5800666.1 RDD family protein [Gammaproteobacteria bacterium]